MPREVRLHLPDLLALTRDARHAGRHRARRDDQRRARRPGRRAALRPRRLEPHARRHRAGRPRRPPTPGPFLVLERFHLAIAAVTIVAATVFLLALTIMLVDERRETVGVLRLIGLPARRILVQILLEGALIAGAGSLFGLLLAAASETLINRFFQWRYDTALIFVRITPDVAALCLAIAVPLGAAATVAASWALLRRNGLRLARR